jgi:TolB-like protein/DNA-binding winged helix-turn-helix (wHTH) protein/Tfp pilus assembly protein PilF
MPETGWSGVWRWGDFQVDPAVRELRRANQRVTVQDQPREVLVALLERAGREVSRDELFTRLWPEDTFVDRESGLNTAVRKLRDVLGDDAQMPRFIETRARHGYRFIARLDSVATPAVVEGAPPPEAASPRARFWLVGAAALLVVAVGLLAWRRTKLADVGAEHAVLVVLPFENLSGDAEQEYFSDGMTDEMISRLGQLRGRVSVLGGATSRHYKASGQEAGEFARELGADYTLAGSVRRSGDRVRITAELVRTRDQRLLWSQSFDRELRDLLDLQRDVADAISSELPAFDGASARQPSRPVEPEAYEAYLRGRYLWGKVSVENERRAIALFQEAIRLDPTFAAAYAWQGSAYQMLGNIGGLRPRETLEKAWPLVTRGVELDPQSPDTLGCLGWTALIYRWDFPQAERAFRRALELNPDHANARQGLATYLAVTGHLDEALREIELARRNDPFSLLIDVEVGNILRLAGRNEEALGRLQQSLQLDPNFAPTHYFLSSVYHALGRHRESVEEGIRTATLGFGSEPPWVPEERRAFEEGGWLGWNRYWAELSKVDPEIELYGSLDIAWTYLNLGSRKDALDWLDKAFVQRPYGLVYLAVDPVWAPLHGEPRYQELVRKIGRPPIADFKTAAAN